MQSNGDRNDEARASSTFRPRLLDDALRRRRSSVAHGEVWTITAQVIGQARANHASRKSLAHLLFLVYLSHPLFRGDECNTAILSQADIKGCNARFIPELRCSSRRRNCDYGTPFRTVITAAQRSRRRQRRASDFQRPVFSGALECGLNLAVRASKLGPTLVPQSRS
jgi:hypothetical protein